MLHLLPLLVLILLLADRARLLASFGFRYVDQDQAVYWLMATDGSRGRFYEPCFYGQAYNIPVEAWLASPLVAFQVPPWVAVPLAATFCGLAPFGLLAACCLRRQPLLAAVILGIPLVLPLPYAMLSSIFCGFGNGLLPATVAAALLLYSKNRFAPLLAGFLAALALVINASSALLVLPVLVWFVLRSGKSFRPPGLLIAGATLASPLYLFIVWFYHRQPERIVWYHEPITFHLDYLFQLLTHPALVFGAFVPIAGAGFLFWPILGGMLVLLGFRRQWPALAAGILLTFILLASLGTSRVFQSAAGVYLSYSRLYLALPVAFAVGLILLHRAPHPPSVLLRRFQPVLLTSIVAVAAALLALRHATFNQIIGHTVQWPGPLRVLPVGQLRDEVQSLATLAQQTGARLVLIPKGDAVRNYAYAALARDQFDTLLLESDRRIWRRQQEYTRHDHSVLLLLDGQDPPRFAEIAARQFSPITTPIGTATVLQLTTSGQSSIDVAQALADPR